MSTPAGWYADPNDSSKERYWDGSEWTVDWHHLKPDTARAPGQGEPGWYVDPTDSQMEAYWTGSNWDYSQQRARQNGTPELPLLRSAAAATAGERRNSFAAWGTFTWIIAALSFLGAVIGGISLMAHKECETFACYSATHPFVGVGAAILIGGALQSLVIAAVSKLCFEAARR